MDKKQIKFGTDGIRGKVGEELTPEIAYGLGWALGNISERPILVGRDTRRSGDMLMSAIVAGILATGTDVVNVGIVSTPILIYASYIKKFSYAVMITASHNPSSDNGIKVIGPNGLKIDKKIQEYIEESIYVEHKCVSTCGRVINNRVLIDEYISHILSKTSIKLDGLKVVLDVANGSNYRIAPEVMIKKGIQTFVFNNNPDGININEKCGSNHIEYIIEELKNKSIDFDLGFSYDGDGDRVIAFLSDGTVIDGDRILYFLAIISNQDKLTMTVMSELGIISDLKEIGVDVSLSEVGDSKVIESMIKNGCRFGGEKSGHIIDLEYLPSGDGLYISLLLLGLYQEDKSLFLSLLNSITHTYRFEKNIYCKNCFNIERSKLERIKMNYISEELNLVIRPSGTEPYIRIMIQGFDEKKVIDCSKTIELEIERLVR